MNGHTLHRCIAMGKSILCILLVFNLHVMYGCGTTGINAGPTAGAYQIVLTETHPLSQALNGTVFQGATMMEILPQSDAFRLLYPDTTRQVSGTYEYINDEISISSFTFKQNAGSATITFDTQRRIMTITSSDGHSWTRSYNDAAREGALAVVDTSNRYLAANMDILEVASSIDAGGGFGGTTGGTSGASGGTTNPGTTGPGGGYKPGSADVIDGVGFILAVVAAIWAPLVGILGPLVTILTVTSVLEGTLIHRFDGNWRATNASSNMLVTVSGGKITKLVDESSQQELGISDSSVSLLSGNRIVWTVLAKVLGQAANVEFTFDVQELANGSLEGTLTALGTNFARVPVTMTRN